MAKNGNGMIIGSIAVIALILFLGFMVFGPENSVISVGGDSGDANCELQPTIDLSLVNAINKGTSVTGASTQAIVNGVFKGEITSSTNFAKGDSVELLINATNYIDKVGETVNVECGVNSVQDELFATSTNTFRIFNTNNQLLTDLVTGGATNQSTSASPINLEIKVDSTTDESTGDLLIVIEAENTTEVDQMTLSGSGASKASVPEFYAVNTANAITVAYDVPAVIDGATQTMTLSISPETGETIGAGTTGVYVTAYSKQAFADTDGTFITGVENDDGTIKYEDTWDYDFMIA